MRTLKTFYFRGLLDPACAGKNWGDAFTPFLFSKLYGIEVEWAAWAEAELVSTGSILDPSADWPCPNWSGHVLGSGIMRSDSVRDLTDASVHLLRGKLTRERCVISGTEPLLGDPGILAYLFAKPVQREFEFGIIPHYVDKACYVAKGDPLYPVPPERYLGRFWRVALRGAHVIDVTSGVQNVIDEASRCKRIVSSSLHGLVLADSLGIPNHFVKLSDGVAGRGFKFNDYYSVYGETLEPTLDVEEAFNLCKTRDTEKAKAAVRQAFDDFVQSWKKGLE
jgi:pyruvyltransferase